MQIDFLGAESVLMFIESTKLSKYRIERANTPNGSFVSVYEYLDSNNNVDAVEDFKNRACKFINPNVVYKITCFDFAEQTTDESGNVVTKKSKGKSGKLAGLFCLNGAGFKSSGTGQQHEAQNMAFDAQEFEARIIERIAKKQEENAILNEIRELKTKFAKLEEEEAEEEEEESGTIAGIKPEQLSQLAGLINLFKGGANPATINGTDETGDKAANINKAIKILYKHDKQLDTDLLKLAEIAETKTETFKMLISSLRSL